MNRKLFPGALLVAACFMVTAKTVLAQSGHIQIESEPGVTVFLNDDLQGVTSSEFGGLIIQNVPAGNHLLRFTLDGFNPQEERIALRPGQVYVHRVRSFVPRVRITEHGKTGDQQIGLQVGRLKIQSLPVAITITIPELEVEYNKSRDEWKAHDIPVGSYAAVFTHGNRSKKHEFAISNNQQTHLFVNLIENRVDDLESTPVKEHSDPIRSAPFQLRSAPFQLRSAPFQLEWEGDFNRAPLVQPLPNYHNHQSDSDAVISVRFEVRPDGTVGRLQSIIKANPELEREVFRTLRSWRFSRLPANMPQESQYGTITFRFIRK